MRESCNAPCNRPCNALVSLRVSIMHELHALCHERAELLDSTPISAFLPRPAIRYHQRMQTALAEVDLTRVSDDAYVHTGDLVQLVHLETGSTLAGDPHDADPRPGEEACAATAAIDVRSPCARNTFVILKYKPSKSSALEPYYEDDALRYGQKIRLALNPAANGLPLDSAGGPRPLCLFSKVLSTTHFAKYSRKQLVGLTYRETFDTVWQASVVFDQVLTAISQLNDRLLSNPAERCPVTNVMSPHLLPRLSRLIPLNGLSLRVSRCSPARQSCLSTARPQCH